MLLDFDDPTSSSAAAALSGGAGIGSVGRTRVGTGSSMTANRARMAAVAASTSSSSFVNFHPSYPLSTTPTTMFGTQQICTFDQWTHLPDQPGSLRIFALIFLLAMLVIVVVGGNALVIAAVLMRRRLRTATGLLILSLAVADMLVGLVVLPFSIANEVLNGFWIFGDTWCTAWLTIDIWMCTSSVFNLVAISIDRYIAIIKPLNYHALITKFRARVIVAVVWISSFIVCTPSFLLASSERISYIEQQMAATNGSITSAQQFVLQNPEACRCTPSNSGMYYILFSASSSFYIPMGIVIFVYARIYIAAMAATKSQYAGMVQVAENANKKPPPPTPPLEKPHTSHKTADNKQTTTEANGNVYSSALNLSKRLLFGKNKNGSKSSIQQCGNSERHQFEMHRLSADPSRAGSLVPICIQSGSTPIVYAQINNSCDNLKYIAMNNNNKENAGAAKSIREPNSVDFCRSEEQLLLHKRNEQQQVAMSQRKYSSIPSKISAVVNDMTQEKTLQTIATVADAAETNAGCATVICKNSDNTEYNSSSSGINSNNGAEECKPMLQQHQEQQSKLAANPINGIEANGTVRPEPDNLLFYQQRQQLCNNVDTTQQIAASASATTNISASSRQSICKSIGGNNRKKQRNLIIYMLMRIIGKTKRRRAAGSYEKRLSLEIKAAKTVAIVTGCFIFCWLGFSIYYGLTAFDVPVNEVVWSVFFWLGYLNSAFNPVIYTLFNREFRTCFKQLLTCNNMIFASKRGAGGYAVPMKNHHVAKMGAANYE